MIKYDKDDKSNVNLLCATIISISKAIDKINYKTEGLSLYDFASDWEVYDIVHRNMEIIGEAIKRLIPYNQETKEVVDTYGLMDVYPSIQWRALAGVKDIIIHQYDNLNQELLFNIIHEDLPDLENVIDGIYGDEYLCKHIEIIRSEKDNYEQNLLNEYKKQENNTCMKDK